jgi:hypothetical protein
MFIIPFLVFSFQWLLQYGYESDPLSLARVDT